ncbi:MAG: hypothetical protein P4M08_04885 [Oligoflexia bacterium]|nr:hypothetical protein [Oligoflexia bacterium]
MSQKGIVFNSAALIIFLSLGLSKGYAAGPHGKCSDYKWDLSHEFTIWKQKPLTVNAAVTSEKAPAATVSKRILVNLESEKLLKLRVKPKYETPKDQSSFGGFVAFEVPFDGDYRISSGSRLWFEVIADGTAQGIDPTSEDMQSGCESIVKSMLFPLKAHTRYVLQMTGSMASSTNFLVTQFESGKTAK